MGTVTAIPFWMDDEKRRHIAQLCAAIIDTCMKHSRNPLEMYIALQECRAALGEKYSIQAVEMFENPTEKLE